VRQILRNVALALALTGLFAVLAVSARAGDDVPRGPVEEGYAITIKMLAAKGKARPPAWRPPHRDRLMSKSLAALFARDDLYQDESGDMGQIGADPFLNGQDGEIKKLNFDTIPVAAGKATVLANFRNFGKPVTVQFQMIREDGGWRIDDIVNHFEGKDSSIREQLSQPYDCGSFMNKPCKR
jgi:hypothetical protein